MEDFINEKFASYPVDARQRLEEIRNAILFIAKDENVGEITEQIKWGELSYSSENGSPLRMNWNAKTPESVSVYFNCQTQLVSTFKEVFPSAFKFIGNRELVIPVSGPYAAKELERCIYVAMRYHQIKKLPLLGM